jgi:hypothetical protein
MRDDARTQELATAVRPPPDGLQGLVEAIVDQRTARLAQRIEELERRLAGLDSRGGERLREAPEADWRP